jgi:hypothetical protein
MSLSDLEILKEIEDEIGIKFKKVEYDIRDMFGVGAYYSIKKKTIVGISIREISLKKVPKEISALVNLKSLDLSNNQISEIPKEISALVNLERLILYSNQISKIPKEISALVNLKSLDFRKNQLTEIPKEISNLKKIQIFFLDNNNISKFPDNFLELNNKIIQNLQDCYLLIDDAPEMKINLWEKGGDDLLDRGKIVASVPSKTECKIKKINSNNRAFIETPYGSGWVLSGMIKGLDWLYLDGNPIIEENLYEIKDLFFLELISYLLKIKEGGSQPLNEAKILVVGDERVGKTSIINRIVGNPFDKNQNTTEGIDIQNYRLENEIKVNIWDFAGQEITHQTHQFFLSTRSLYLFVIDAQKEDDDSNIFDWLETIKSNSGNSPIIIVINKIDENNNYKFDEFRYDKNFNIVDIIFISAEKNKNIDKLISSISNNIEKLDEVKKGFPKEWFEIKEELEKFSSDNKDYIERSDFDKICDGYSVKIESDQNTLLKILHEMGTIVSYKNQRLNNVQIINPMWITNAVYKIIRSKLINDNATLAIEELHELFKDDDRYKKRHYNWIMDLLNQFELSFSIGKNKVLIPSKLPLNEPPFDLKSYQTGLNFRYKYESKLKKNIISQFIVKISRYIDKSKDIKYWRRGVFLEYENNKAVVISEEEKKVITIAIRTDNEQGREFLAIIRDKFREINQNLIVNEEIPLIIDGEIVGFEEYEYLVSLENDGVKYIRLKVETQKRQHEFDISKLLNGYKSKENKNEDRSVKVINNITNYNDNSRHVESNEYNENNN